MESGAWDRKTDTSRSVRDVSQIRDWRRSAQQCPLRAQRQGVCSVSGSDQRVRVRPPVSARGQSTADHLPPLPPRGGSPRGARSARSHVTDCADRDSVGPAATTRPTHRRRSGDTARRGPTRTSRPQQQRAGTLLRRASGPTNDPVPTQRGASLDVSLTQQTSQRADSLIPRAAASRRKATPNLTGRMQITTAAHNWSGRDRR